MARPKEFDKDTALHKAICLFSQQGFAATSTDQRRTASAVEVVAAQLVGRGNRGRNCRISGNPSSIGRVQPGQASDCP
jgi:hypothetical protein